MCEREREQVIALLTELPAGSQLVVLGGDVVVLAAAALGEVGLEDARLRASSEEGRACVLDESVVLSSASRVGRAAPLEVDRLQELLAFTDPNEKYKKKGKKHRRLSQFAFQSG